MISFDFTSEGVTTIGRYRLVLEQPSAALLGGVTTTETTTELVLPQCTTGDVHVAVRRPQSRGDDRGQRQN